MISGITSGAVESIEKKVLLFVFSALAKTNAPIVPRITAPVAVIEATCTLIFTACQITELEKSSLYHFKENPVQIPGKKDELNEKTIKKSTGRYKNAYPEISPNFIRFACIQPFR
jgi:hypothetical protein